MKLEQQVVSLDLAKRLKELGVKQESYHCWWDGISGWSLRSDHVSKFYNGNLNTLCAFSVAELGEMLPEAIDGNTWHAGKYSGGYGIDFGKLVRRLTSQTEADVRAKMLIHLVEHKLITLT